MYQEIDTILRIILMGFFLVFTIRSFMNFKDAKDNELDVSAKYFLSMSIFFLISLINYIQAEINLQFHVFPNIEYPIPLGTPPLMMPLTTVMFFLFFVPSVLPVIYVNEIYFQKWKNPYVTVLGIVSFMILFITITIPAFTLILLVISLITMVLMFLIFLSLYIKMAIKSTGTLKKSASMMIIGWLSLLFSLLVPLPFDPAIQPIFNHSIAIFASICLYFGIKLSSE
jgi:hypothetical protein